MRRRARHARHRARPRHAGRHAAPARRARDLRPVLPARGVRGVLKDVKALADALGERRDPDVQIAALAGVRRGADARRRRGRAWSGCRRSSARCRRRATRCWPPRCSAWSERGLRERLLALATRRRAKSDGGWREGPQGQGARPRRRARRQRASASSASGSTSCAGSCRGPPIRRRSVALHDMRIAAKRLRYVLEVSATCFGPYATRRPSAPRSSRTCSARSTTATSSSRGSRRSAARLLRGRRRGARALAGDAEDLDPALVTRRRTARLPRPRRARGATCAPAAACSSPAS